MPDQNFVELSVDFGGELEEESESRAVARDMGYNGRVS